MYMKRATAYSASPRFWGEEEAPGSRLRGAGTIEMEQVLVALQGFVPTKQPLTSMGLLDWRRYLVIKGSPAHLIEIGGGFTFSHTIEVLHVHQLVLIAEPRVGYLVLWPLGHMWQVAKGTVAPAVEGTEGGAGPPLCV